MANILYGCKFGFTGDMAKILNSCKFGLIGHFDLFADYFILFISLLIFDVSSIDLNHEVV